MEKTDLHILDDATRAVIARWRDAQTEADPLYAFLLLEPIRQEYHLLIRRRNKSRALVGIDGTVLHLDADQRTLRELCGPQGRIESRFRDQAAGI